MKKVFVIQEFAKERDLRNSEYKNLLILAYRNERKLYLQNFESLPKGSVDVEFDHTTGKVTLSFCLQNSQFLAVGDHPGIAEKQLLLDKKV
jgi:hypothetical protein